MTMKILLSACMMIAFQSVWAVKPQTKVIAHRGFWETENAAQNSIASLKKATAIKCYGSEFDVQMTSDGELLVFHDAKVQGKVIENTPYDSLKMIRLSNGEGIPTLDEYLQAAQKLGKTRLILEIKPHSTPEKESEVVKKVLEKVKAAGLMSKTDYISFSLYIVKEIVRLLPEVQVAYLEGDLTPEEAKAAGCTGLDYHYRVFQKNPDWIKRAHDLGLTVNVWTVDKEEIMREMTDRGVDFITTNQPVLLQNVIKKQ